jgi:hypothetical protein
MRKKIASDIAHITIRIREDLRKKLAKAAESEQRSLNTEISKRLEESFEAKGRAQIEDVAERLRATSDKLEAERNRNQRALMSMAHVWLRLAAETSDVEAKERYRGFANELRELMKQAEPHSTEEEK